jgi:hypothetical protein
MFAIPVVPVSIYLLDLLKNNNVLTSLFVCAASYFLPLTTDRFAFIWPRLNKYLENEIYLYCMLVSSFIARVL